MAREVARSVEAIWRIESGRIVGGVVRLVRDVGLAEDLAQEAMVAARAEMPAATDWKAIVAAYGELLEWVPSPVVALNRAVAVGMADGPAAALPLVDTIQGNSAMQHYGLLHAVRGDPLARLGRRTEACEAFERAAELATNGQDKALMERRAGELRD